MDTSGREMISYTYLCRCCDTEFEIEQSIKDEAIAECPKCRVCTSNRLIVGTGGFILRGDCWSRDLYASGISKDDDK